MQIPAPTFVRWSNNYAWTNDEQMKWLLISKMCQVNSIRVFYRKRKGVFRVQSANDNTSVTMLRLDLVTNNHSFMAAYWKQWHKQRDYKIVSSGLCIRQFGDRRNNATANETGSVRVCVCASESASEKERERGRQLKSKVITAPDRIASDGPSGFTFHSMYYIPSISLCIRGKCQSIAQHDDYILFWTL